MEAEISELLMYLIQGLGAVLLGVGSVVAKKVGDYVGGETGDKLERYLDKIIAEGVSYAKKQGKKEAKGSSVDTGSRAANMAIQFVAENAPKTLKKLGYTHKQLEQRVESWL